MWTGPVAFMGSQEILIIGGIIVLIFGGSKLPQLAKGMGESIREFRKATDDSGDAITPNTKAA